MENKDLKPRKNPRLIVRLGFLLISHSDVVSVVCCLAGFIALLVFPLLAKNTYISENALMPGSANPMFSNQNVGEANKFIKAVIGSMSSSQGRKGIGISRLIAESMVDLGADAYYHKYYYSSVNQFHPVHFFSTTHTSRTIQENVSHTSHGLNSIGIIRAPQGDGKEAIVLVSPYNSEKFTLNDAVSLGLTYSIFSLLSQVTWLGRDIIWLAVDSPNKEYTSVSEWLKEYHYPDFSSDCEYKESGGRISSVFKRAGTMAAALVIKIGERKDATDKDTLSIYAEASNGQMPNLDLINVVQYLAVHRQGLHVKIKRMESLLSSVWLKKIGEFFLFISNVVGSLNPRWKFGIPSADYVEGAATFASSLYSQALGVPTGSHGAFRDYQVDAITLEISPKFSLNNEHKRAEFLLKNGRLIEGIIRSVNNLLEKFHQSFFLYILTSPNKFISVGVYMIAFVLLLVPLPVLSAALYSGRKRNSFRKKKTNEPSTPIAEAQETGQVSWQWLKAAKSVLIVHLWAIVVSLLPYLIYQIPHRTSTKSMLIWIMLSILALFILHYCFSGLHPNSDWHILKAVMIAAVTLSLGLMSIVNFATAQLGVLIMVPMCLVVQPIKYIYWDRSFQSSILTACNLMFAIIGCPIITLLIIKGSIEGYSSISLGFCWDWIEVLWTWNSAAYLYLMGIHLPCWVLYMNILLYS